MEKREIAVLQAAKDLYTNPNTVHWEVFRKLLLRSRAKYYKVFYPKKLKSKKELLDAYAVIYDSKYRQMFRIPIYVREKNDIRGATIYFKELLNTNKDYKEWIA
ncbi:MAG: hypothetical protein QXK65_01885 [Candidatus Micrarchaeaceae archaeon]